jgi:predicted kinase
MQAIILIGVQACGKSTFFKRHFVDTHLRLNLDMLKTRHRETLLLEALIGAKQPFVVDNTNPSKEERARYIEPARAAGFEVVGYYFSSRVREALERNSARLDAARVPDAAIFGTAGRLERPEYSEGFDVLHYVQIAGDEFRVSEWEPDAD